MLQVAVINESTAIADSLVQSFLVPFGKQWNEDLTTVWPVTASQFVFVPKKIKPPAGSWWLVFLDDTTQAGHLAYHDLTDEGRPLSKVFVRTIQAENASVSVGASHELCEMAVDPWLNSAYQDPQGVFWAGEICDPVQGQQYGYEVDGLPLSDFVSPNWFGHKHAQATVDFRGHVRSPFQVLAGAYAQRWNSRSGWQEHDGQQSGTNSRGTAPAGSRRERRRRGSKNWKNSVVTFDSR